MHHRSLIVVSLAMLSITLSQTISGGRVSSAAQHKEDLELFPSAEIKWKDGPPSVPKGAMIAVLEGDPTKAGPFVFRIKLPDGYRIPPHTHPQTERVTVISGTFNIGMGDTFDEKKTR